MCVCLCVCVFVCVFVCVCLPLNGSVHALQLRLISNTRLTTHALCLCLFSLSLSLSLSLFFPCVVRCSTPEEVIEILKEQGVIKSQDGML